QGSGSVRPSGQVTFFDGAVSLGTATLVQSKGSMRATFSTSALTTGFHLLTAQYLGNATFAASTSSPLAEPIFTGAKPGGTSTLLSTSANPATVSQLITFTATVKASGKTAPTGSVRFFVDGIQIGDSSLTPGGGKASSTAVVSLDNLAVGTHG